MENELTKALDKKFMNAAKYRRELWYWIFQSIQRAGSDETFVQILPK